MPFFAFILDIQQLGNLGEVDVQILVDINLDNGIKWILDTHEITIEVIYCYGLSLRIHYPILTHSIILVVEELADIIVGWIARGNNLDNEIGCSIAPLIIQFILITDNHYVRLNDYQRSIGQLDIEWCIEYAARSFLAENVVVYNCRKLHGDCLVYL